jgi:tRNA guanosine-2'-O-methyltransferase
MKAGGRLFQPAIMYLLDGLIQGLKARSEKTSTQPQLKSSEIDEILGLARLTGLAEVASDLHSVQCQKLCDLVCPDLESLSLPTAEALRSRCQKLENPVDQSAMSGDLNDGGLPSLQSCLDMLRKSKHKSIQGPAFAPTCKSLVKLLDQENVASIDASNLHDVLAALWEEAEIRDFIRPFAIHLPPLLFHPTCVQVCVTHNQRNNGSSPEELQQLLSKAMRRLQKLSKGRSYVLAVLARSLRKAAFANPSIMSLLPFDDFILEFVNDPASIRPEFLFEVAAAGKLQQSLPHRTYTSYYGLREWHAYAALIDLLRRFPKDQLSTAKRILNSLVEPWKNQQPPVAVKSPWKKTLQLQAMLLLSDYCITESDADDYLRSLTHALSLESWPRYRYILEWILARIYCRFPGKSSCIIDELGNLDDYSPIHIASLMKLGLLIAPHESKEFGIKLMTQLNSYSASPKVQIRHEANYAFPLVFDMAIAKKWDSVTGNPAFVAMNAFIRRLDKFNASPWTIRTLKLDIEQDFSLTGILQGRYLSIESPEQELVKCEDFEALESYDISDDFKPPPSHIMLGERPAQDTVVSKPAASEPSHASSVPDQTVPITLQTKAGIDLDNLHPPSGPPSAQNQRPASVMLVASLIDNPTNLGGLSRIAESFGLEALYIDDLKKVAHKDFKATSVRSEKHLAINELKETDVPAFLLEAKSKGYEVVGIEQTDRSGILGEKSKTSLQDTAQDGDASAADNIRGQDIGTLPKKCCLVLGSEKEGISAEVLAVIDRNVEIKTVGVTRSLSKLKTIGRCEGLPAALRLCANAEIDVQTAGGIALYEWWRERGGKT